MSKRKHNDLPPKVRDLRGQVFFYLKVVSFDRMYYSEGGTCRVYWNCQCLRCGSDQIKSIASVDFKLGKTKTCGCLERDSRHFHTRTHGLSHTKVYNTWLSIIARCCHEKNTCYGRYGGSGITVCDRWRDSFENFFADMGQPPTAKHSIDRINNDGPYSPENCRWATHSQQMRNKSDSKYLTLDGETLHVMEWAKKTGLKPNMIRDRIRYGWPVERILNPSLFLPNGKQRPTP